MDTRNSAVRPFPAKSKEKRAYGKAPLEFALDAAIEAVHSISQQGKTLSESKLAAVLGNTTTSSAFTRKVRALASYGLLEQQADQLNLTDLAIAIVLPQSPQAQAEAKKDAFLKIDQFAMLFNQHKGKLLPADEFLRNIVEQQADIPRDVSATWVKQFKDGARAAGLFHLRGDGKVQITESPVFGDSADDILPPRAAESSVQQPAQPPTPAEPARLNEMPTPMPNSGGSGHRTRIDLSDGRQAEIFIPDKLNRRDANKLKRALEGIALIIDSMALEDQ